MVGLRGGGPPGSRRAPVAFAGAGAVVVVALVVLATVLVTDGPDPDAGDPPAGAASSTPSTAAPAPGADEPAPGVGGGGKDEAARPRVGAVPLTASSRAAADLSVQVVRLEWVQGRTTIPGETGGNALRVTVRASNEGQRPVELAGSVTNMFYGEDRTPAGTLLEPGFEPFPSQVAPGQSVDGVSVFTMPRLPQEPILVEVDLDDALRIVSFRGRPSELM